MRPFISACIIVKNEEEMLRNCLESIRSGVDEIIIVDTGSTDSTKKIAREFTKKVYDYEWENDFSAARNFAAAKASGDWIVAIDADECVDVENLKGAVKEIEEQKDQYNMYLVEITSFSGSLGESTTVNQMLRIYKNDGSICFKRAIHEQLQTVEGKPRINLSSLKLYHYGYLTDVVEKQDKKNRNVKIIQKDLKNENNKAFSFFNYGQELRRLKETEEALNNFVKAYSSKENVNEGWVRICLFYIVESLVILKRYEEALKIICDVEELWPMVPDFVFWRGEIYFAQKRFEDAKEVYLQILSQTHVYKEVVYHLDRKSFLPNERLGQIYELEKKYNEAIKHYIEAFNENPFSVRIIVKIIWILSKHYSSQEVYDFIVKQNMIRTDNIRIEVLKYVLNNGLTDLVDLFVSDMAGEDESLKASIKLKVRMITSNSMNDILKIGDIQSGIQKGLFDWVDLCILYEMTHDAYIKELFKGSDVVDIFDFVFGEPEQTGGIKQKEYLDLLDRGILYNKVDFVEKLIALKHLTNHDVDAKIADILYKNQYEDIALEFYQLANENDITEQGYVNIIEWLINNENNEEAYRITLEAVEKFGEDFRFYHYLVELNMGNTSMVKVKLPSIFSNSNWLNKKITQSNNINSQNGEIIVY